MENLERMENFKETNPTKIKNSGKNNTNNSLLNSKLQTPKSNFFSKGITLIALVVTIVILLILAAITINLVLSEGGLFERAQQSEEDHEKAVAREKLELKLADMQAEKLINNRNYTHGSKDYEYLSTELREEGYIVNEDEDIVTVDDWQFLIDRSVPKIIDDSLGKGNRNEEIQVEIAQPNAQTDFIKATINIKITSAEEINSITINGEPIEITSFTKETVDGKIVYIGTKEVENNGTYSIIAKNIKDEYNNRTIRISSITEDMDIWNKADLKLFGKKVNEEGRTFEGKTVRVMANIDFNPGKYTVAEDGTVTFEPDAEQWIPIANYAADNTLTFKGTFEGNNHTISGLYINNASSHQGLFGKNEGTIKGVIVSGKIVSSGERIAGIVATNHNKISNCKNNAYIQGSANVGGICGLSHKIINNCSNMNEIFATSVTAGGIVGNSYSDNAIVDGCYNTGYVHASMQAAGGIVGHQQGGLYASNCYNTGTVYSPKYTGGINGASGTQEFATAYTYNCYNLGSISGSSYVGDITGLSNANGGTSQDVNCYTTNATAELLNANDYSKDENGEYVWTNDIQNPDGTWKYNNGYPILKWQLKQ